MFWFYSFILAKWIPSTFFDSVKLSTNTHLDYLSWKFLSEVIWRCRTYGFANLKNLTVQVQVGTDHECSELHFCLASWLIYPFTKLSLRMVRCHSCKSEAWSARWIDGVDFHPMDCSQLFHVSLGGLIFFFQLSFLSPIQNTVHWNDKCPPSDQPCQNTEDNGTISLYSEILRWVMGHPFFSANSKKKKKMARNSSQDFNGKKSLRMKKKNL